MTSSHFSAYIEVKHLTKGHSDTINSLSFSPGGTHLASGGDDFALIIWNIPKGHLLYRLLFDVAVDCVLWHPTHPETVIVGLSNGYLGQVYGFSLLTNHRHDIDLGARSTVHCLDYDSTTSCLAIGMGEEVHLTREVSPNSYTGDIVLHVPSEPGVVGANSTLPLRAVTVKFLKAGTQVIASYLGHGVICWDIASRDTLWHMKMPERTPNIGSSALSPSQRFIVVYNLVNGLDLYNVGGNGQQSPRKTYRFKEDAQSPYLLQVQFIHGGKALVCGTTTGGVLLWETASGEPLQELSHGEDVIRAVNACACDKHSLIATGSAAKGQGTYIKIWRTKRANDGNGPELPDAVDRIVQAVTAQRLSFNELVTHLVNVAVGLAICALLGWIGIRIPWIIVWDNCLLATEHVARTARAGAEVAIRGGIEFADYVSTEGSAMAVRIVDAVRDACVAFLFPAGPPYAPAVDL